jgi:hypothetical protein
MTKEDFFASIMNSETQHPRDPSRPKRQSRMSREIVSSSELRDNPTEIPGSHQLRVDNSMLVAPTLEWQDHLSSCYAVTDKPRTSDSSVNPGSQPSPQRRRLGEDTGSTPVEWGRLYKIDPPSAGECGPQLPESTNCAYRSLSVLSRFQSPTTTLTIPHQWSKNCHSTRTKRYVASQPYHSAQ